MRLTKLELHGFKSFADRTVMEFDQGVTAIVGPNGCGKSNVSDAVRWVLGEQRARILRGAKMEEVIFQGSSARRAVNIAEVALHFENEDGSLPVPFREVVIARRLSRSGESEYLMNGAICRLRDIHDMVRGTGLGADSGVVIEAKMIDALLSDRPDDRRELFEEAAGVSLYRDRRRSTERRLEETTHDLARLDDLITEVQSQVRSLARQRKKAERHAELTERRFTVELTLASREMQSWREELAALETRLVTLREEAPLGEQRVGEAERTRDLAHERRSAAEAKRHELAKLVATHQGAVQALRSEIAVAEERHRNAEARRQRAEFERREGQAYEERLRDESARANTDVAQLEADLSAIDSELRERAQDEERAREALLKARSAVEQSERAARALRDRLREAELDRERGTREMAEIDERLQLLEGERGVLADAAAVLQREIDAADDAVEIARERVAASLESLEGARLAARGARENDTAARAEFRHCEELCTQLEARVRALEGLERERVGLAPAALRLLRDRDRFGDGAVLGPLSDFVTAEANAAALVERFLGMTVHAVVVRDTDVAERVRDWHQASNPGPLLLLPLDAIPQRANGGADLLAPVETAPPVAGWVRALLSHVRTMGEGAFVDARGAVWLPGAGGGPGPLRRRAELYALRGELASAEEQRRTAALETERSHEALATADARVAAMTEAAAAAQDDDRGANDHRAELERRRVREARDFEEAAALHERLTTRRAELVRGVAEIELRARDLTETALAYDADGARQREGLAEAEQALEVARERRSAGQVQQAQAQARVQVAADRARRLRAEAESAHTRLSSLGEELASLQESDRALAEQMAAWQSELTMLAGIASDAEARLLTAEQDVVAADRSLSEADHALDAARRDAVVRADELHHAELRFTELSGRRAAIRERLEAEWRRPLEELLSSLEPALDLFDDALRAEAEALRAEVERLGPVNPLAIEEHDEEVKRLDFLTSQRNDLSDARNKLQLAIKEIDTTARELFMSTFARIRENFHQIFMTLFGGGECDLRLENPEVPLDCDIEIHASPRGKRTQRIHLLSSGERALVALSLLFGIFLTKPSPFCLLDEVDAPLDDANIGRFVRMLNQFKTNTQFIVITHNPRTTTEAADAVYGVTMQEPGVSSVVSVRMRGAAVDEPAPEEAAEVVMAAPA